MKKILLSSLVSLACGFHADAAISITALNSPVAENFDSLANSGTSSSVPSGWAFAESGVNANTTYTAGTGSSNAGDTYSFGASGSSERAFGMLQSGSLLPIIGASFQNDTGDTIVGLAISYAGEQWRIGTIGRLDKISFQYSLDATSLTIGTWTPVTALDFIAPTTSGAAGALDGNAAANRTLISGTLSSLAIAPNSTFWLRWVNFDATGADDGLAVDDFSLAAVPEPSTVLAGALCGIGMLASMLRRHLKPAC